MTPDMKFRPMKPGLVTSLKIVGLYALQSPDPRKGSQSPTRDRLRTIRMEATMKEKKTETTALAKSPSENRDPALLALFVDATKLGGLIPANAGEIKYVPGVTIDPGVGIQGTYLEMREGTMKEEHADPKTGEIKVEDKTWPEFLIEVASGEQVWVRGGFQLGQLMKQVDTGSAVTIIRARQDKKHPTKPALRIAQFQVFVG